MTKQLTPMKGEEFIKKILAGEKDYTGIALEKDFDLSGHDAFQEVNRHLVPTDFGIQDEEPSDNLQLSGSQFIGLKAKRLHLPWMYANDVNFRRADFSEAYLEKANLSGADLEIANLSGANLRSVNFRRADLEGANLYCADLEGANLKRTNLYSANLDGADLRRADLKNTIVSKADLRRADIRDVKNLDNCPSLLTAIFYETKVNKREKEIIENFLRNFDVRE